MPRHPPGSHTIIYTDGFWKPNVPPGVGAIFIPHPELNLPREWISGIVPSGELAQWSQRLTNIINVEAYGALFALYNWIRLVPCNTRLLLFNDNQAVFAMICRCSAREDDTNVIIQRIFRCLERRRIQMWAEWIESDSNPSDGPSRLSILTTNQRVAMLDLMHRLQCKSRSHVILP